MDKNPRIVIKPAVARKLLKLGYKIIDIKPQRQESGFIDFTRSVFLFEYEDGLDDDIQKLLP